MARISPELIEKMAAQFSQLVKEAETREHKRLKSDLSEYAVSLGFTTDCSFANRLNPDALFRFDDFLFVGDAKVSTVELPSRADSAARIGRYIATFWEALHTCEIKGGLLAIATDTPDAAAAWAAALQSMCESRGSRSKNGAAPTFQVHRPYDDRNTWIAWW